MSGTWIIACFVGGGVLAALIYELWFARQAERDARDRAEERMERRLQSRDEL